MRLSRLNISSVSNLVCLFLCLLLKGQTIFSQKNIAFQQTDSSHLAKQLARHEQNFKNRIASLPAASRDDYATIYTLRWKMIKEKFDKKEIDLSPFSQQYLDALTSEIVAANPVLQNKSFTCYFSRSGIPNASYLGEGIILFNMGLFTKLENESQVVFVLCHELAHMYLQHSEESINQYVSAIHPASVKKEFPAIKRKGQRSHPIQKPAGNFTFNSSRKERDNELEADSMAISLMRSTRFYAAEAIRTLELLRDIHDPSIDMATILFKTFDALGFPFQKKWLDSKAEFPKGRNNVNMGPVFTELLNTHPECTTRMQIVNTWMPRFLQPIATSHVDTNQFKFLKKKFRYEIIEHAFTTGNYTRSLYYALQLLEENPADPLVVTQVGNIFKALAEAKQQHLLGKFVELPSPYQPANYNQLLQFVQNLNVEEFTFIGFHYLRQYFPVLNRDMAGKQSAEK